MQLALLLVLSSTITTLPTLWFLPFFKISENICGWVQSRTSTRSLLNPMANKGCELCSKPARMFCESDQARLCWDCDEKVHAANFLVAKHSRTLLCHACASPTQWKAAGLKLRPAVSVCRACAEGEGSGGFGNGNRDCDSQESESDDGEYYSDSDEGEGEDDEGGEEEEGENQVVPWSICSSALASAAAPMVASSCSSEDAASLSLCKRTRDDNHPFESENEEGCCSSHNPDSKLASHNLCIREYENLDSSERTLSRPLKLRRTWSEREDSGKSPAYSSAAVVRTVQRFQQETMADDM
ncbi:uncharacterized protein [Primulina huaijiensis]|uniref:uncharacterized protein n=1 Tax=Primulina huaijiensis TaxID=1492673 RepID=UPI003CC73A55